MTKLIIVAFVAFALVVTIGHFRHRDVQKSLLSTVLIVAMISVSLFDRAMYVFLPLVVVHSIFLIFAWIETFKYILGFEVKVLFLLLPLFSIAFYFLLGIFFANFTGIDFKEMLNL